MHDFVLWELTRNDYNQTDCDRAIRRRCCGRALIGRRRAPLYHQARLKRAPVAHFPLFVALIFILHCAITTALALNFARVCARRRKKSRCGYARRANLFGAGEWGLGILDQNWLIKDALAHLRE